MKRVERESRKLVIFAKNIYDSYSSKIPDKLSRNFQTHTGNQFFVKLNEIAFSSRTSIASVKNII